jgi:glycosyltransferase involved in cell wall biosynthesis
MSVYIDITEFLRHPMVSGIQRVTAEICRQWPSRDLRPVRFDGRTLVVLESNVIAALAKSFRDGVPTRFQLMRYSGLAHRPLTLLPEDTVLVPELFYDPERIDYYQRLNRRELLQCRFIVHDLTTLLYPEFFPSADYGAICRYFQMIRQVPNCGFVSEATQSAHYRHLRRSDELGGVVLRLGSDGLGARPRIVRRDRPMKFSVVGRIESFKNPAMILEAFEPLLRDGTGKRLVFLGKIGNVEPAIRCKIEQMAPGSSGGVEHYSEPDDDLICRHVDESRATIFVSQAEGYGLPPVESLWRGVPVIASSGIPSLEKIGSAGVHVVNPLNALNIRSAAVSFLDDGYMVRKSEEALKLELPTWADFVSQVADWCSAQQHSILAG